VTEAGFRQQWPIGLVDDGEGRLRSVPEASGEGGCQQNDSTLQRRLSTQAHASRQLRRDWRVALFGTLENVLIRRVVPGGVPQGASTYKTHRARAQLVKALPDRCRVAVSPYPGKRLHRMLEWPAMVPQASSEEFDFGVAEGNAVRPGQVPQTGFDLGVAKLGCLGTKLAHPDIELPERPLDIGGRNRAFLGRLPLGFLLAGQREFTIGGLVRAPCRVARLVEPRWPYVAQELRVHGAAGDVVLLPLGKIDPVRAKS
jgi:hypothetical protein